MSKLLTELKQRASAHSDAQSGASPSAQSGAKLHEESRSKPARAKQGTASRRAANKEVTAETALAAAKAVLIKGRKLDMMALAVELGIGRATLYRWTGDRERLIRTVMAGFLEESFTWLDAMVKEQKLRGKERIAREVEEMMRVLTQSKAVRGLLRNEPEAALRILTSSGPDSLQETAIRRLLHIIEHESASGRYKPRLKPRLLAFATVRLVDSYVYGNTIANMKVDLDEASQVLRSLL